MRATPRHGSWSAPVSAPARGTLSLLSLLAWLSLLVQLPRVQGRRAIIAMLVAHRAKVPETNRRGTSSASLGGEGDSARIVRLGQGATRHRARTAWCHVARPARRDARDHLVHDALALTLSPRPDRSRHDASRQPSAAHRHSIRGRMASSAVVTVFTRKRDFLVKSSETPSEWSP